MMLATIVVVNYNGLEHLPPLFAALAGQSCREFEIAFVDNGSLDGSVAAAIQLGRAYGIQTTILGNDDNRGFATACNQGIDASQAEYVILLNNDTRPEVEWFEQLIATARSERNVGMVASKMLFADRPTIINSAGIALDWAGIAWDWRGGEPDILDEQDVVEVFGPCGGAALYSRRMLDEIGTLDEEFFAYLEDVDLACRARLAGWHCLFQPQARVLHAHSATSGEGSPFKSFQLGRNKIWLLTKNYPQPLLASHLAVVVGYDLMAAIYGLIRRRDAALVRGRLAAMRALPRFLAKRRCIQRQWQDVDNWARLVSPVEAPWAVSARYAHLEPGKGKVG